MDKSCKAVLFTFLLILTAHAHVTSAVSESRWEWSDVAKCGGTAAVKGTANAFLGPYLARAAGFTKTGR